MNKLSSNELRNKFLEFFAAQEHRMVPSSPLVPGNDPTLLFTNAGMVQFKDTFLGREPRDYQRAVSSQRCVRAGGKHNDLENVGYTARHHTFFEMLGNFSFGDYFKAEAIHYAWSFLTEELALPKEKLWVTVFEDDDEAAAIWLNEIGVAEKRLTRIGRKADGSSDNFWQMGDTGPCGPCTEIFFDHGPDVAGGPPGTPEEDGDRYIEIWNLVFMQYNRSANGELTALPKPSVDTGMGLERLAAVMQGVHSNYEIDLFSRLIDAVADLTNTKDRSNNSLKVIADHIRSAAFLIVDGVLPSNEGRGYVLRRIIRRAIRHGYKLDVSKPFFNELAAPLDAEMGEAYPELRKALGHVQKVLRQEEDRFAETLDQGMKVLEADLASLNGQEIPGETVFKLYDTYGFPVDLTADIARERDLQLDMPGFEAAMQAQRDRAKAAGKFKMDYNELADNNAETEFTGYTELSGEGLEVSELIANGESVEQLKTGETGTVVLNRSPFYAESGGQVGDTGLLENADGKFAVEDTQKYGQHAIAHIGTVKSGSLSVGSKVAAAVDNERRGHIIRNHSATHILHAALRALLGEHVAQKGSLVDHERLRFDFSHYEPVTPAQLRELEEQVNAQIRVNAAVSADSMSYDDAIEAGAMALFGEKYGDEVRVLKIGEYSTELCGGTHVQRAGDIGLFKIIGETGVASGVRRIEAVTGYGAEAWVQAQQDSLQAVAAAIKTEPTKAAEKVAQLAKRNKALEKELQAAKAQLATGGSAASTDDAVELNGMKLLTRRVDGVDAQTLRDTMDQLRSKLGASVVVLGSVEDDKVRLVAGVSKAETKQVHAGKLVGKIAELVGGKGGGRPDMAQAGGNKPEQLDAALASVPDLVAELLG